MIIAFPANTAVRAQYNILIILGDKLTLFMYPLFLCSSQKKEWQLSAFSHYKGVICIHTYMKQTKLRIDRDSVGERSYGHDSRICSAVHILRSWYCKT